MILAVANGLFKKELQSTRKAVIKILNICFSLEDNAFPLDHFKLVVQFTLVELLPIVKLNSVEISEYACTSYHGFAAKTYISFFFIPVAGCKIVHDAFLHTLQRFVNYLLE